jgi:hypothetical protein
MRLWQHVPNANLCRAVYYTTQYNLERPKSVSMSGTAVSVVVKATAFRSKDTEEHGVMEWLDIAIESISPQVHSNCRQAWNWLDCFWRKEA